MENQTRIKPSLAILMEFPTALGGERSLLSVLGKLKQQFDFYLLAPQQGLLADLIQQNSLKHLLFSVRDANGIRKSDNELLAELLPLLEKVNCQLLHGNSVSISRFLGRHRKNFPMPVTAHLRDIMKLSTKAIQDISQLDRLIAVSAATANSYQAQGVAEEKIETIYNGIDKADFQPLGKLNLHRELGLPAEVKFAVTIGQIGLRKGHDVLVDAIPEIVRVFPDWHFLIVGERYSAKQESVEYADNMLSLLEKNGVCNHVHWLGARDDVADILVQSELLIHPARQEPFGRVLLEAAMQSTAIVATNVGGTAEMLRHQKDAWLIEAGSAVAIQTACKKLFAEACLRKQLGKQANINIIENFTVEASALAHRQVWEQFLAGDS